MYETYILVWDDLDVLDVSSRLENLLQDVFSDPGIQAADIQSPFVGFGGCAPRSRRSRGRGQATGIIARERRADGARNGVVISWDDDRSESWWSHVGAGGAICWRPLVLALVLAMVVALVAGLVVRLSRCCWGVGWWRKRGGSRCSVCHFVSEYAGKC